jgi:hypothetical protein
MGLVRIGMAYGTVGDSDQVLCYLILQMAASLICCCLPIYRSALVDIPVLRKLRSTFRTGGSTNPRDGSNGQQNIVTIGQKSSRDKRKVGQEWLQLDESCSTRHLATTAWADKERVEHDSPGNPIMQTVELRQTVEVV